MSTEDKYIENKSKGLIIDIRCMECNRLTKHCVMTSLDREGFESNREEGWCIDWRSNYQIVQCLGCETVSFRHVSWFSEDEIPEAGEDGITVRLYPKRDANSIVQKNFHNIPTILRRIYGEVIECHNNGCLTLCAAGLRGIVEGICVDQAITDGPLVVKKKGGKTETIRCDNLEAKIFGLCERGILTRPSAEALHGHRFLGNAAMHELMRPSMDELKLAIEIVEHTLEELYEMPEKALELRRKVQRKKT